MKTAFYGLFFLPLLSMTFFCGCTNEDANQSDGGPDGTVAGGDRDTNSDGDTAWDVETDADTDTDTDTDKDDDEESEPDDNNESSENDDDASNENDDSASIEDDDSASIEDDDTGPETNNDDDTESESLDADSQTSVPDGGNPSDSDSETGSDTTVPDAGERFEVDYILASELSDLAPTTVGIVTWSITGVGELLNARIEFGLDQDYGMVAPVDLSEEGYRTLLLGMKPAQIYHFRIVAEDAEGTYTSQNFEIETGAPTDLLSIPSFNIVDAENREPGFIVTSYWRGPNMSTIFIIDPDGEIVWWYETDIEGICRARMSADGKNMWTVDTDNAPGYLGRVTMDGLDYESYLVGTSHDITPVEGEMMAYIDYSEDDCESIFGITPSGDTWEIFEAADHIKDECHGNALRYSKTEDVFTISHLNSDIHVADRDGNLLWQLSDLLGGTHEIWGGRQHGHHLLDNSILIIANEAGTEGAAVLEYDLDGELVFIYDPIPGVESPQLGDVQRLPGGNTMISYSNAASLIREIDAEGNTVLEIDLSGGGPGFFNQNALGYHLWRASLYGPPPDLDL